MSCSICDSIKKLFVSTRELYERFDLDPTPDNVLNCFYEEIDELVEAFLKSDRQHTSDEAADVFVTAIGILLVKGITDDEFIASVKRVVAKNDAKTRETHAVNERGKIARPSIPIDFSTDPSKEDAC